MTRRAVKPQPPQECIAPVLENGWWMWQRFNAERRHYDGKTVDKTCDQKCPYGQPGDRLWVKETYACVTDGLKDGICYRVDGEEQIDREFGERWQSSRFMPRRYSRILLEITDVRVERLQEISEADAKAEGLACLSKDGGRTYKYGIPDHDGLPGTDDTGWPWNSWDKDPSFAFRSLWIDINGIGSWDANPWVWVVCFKRVK